MSLEYCPNCGEDLTQYRSEDEEETSISDLDMSKEEVRAFLHLAIMKRERAEELNERVDNDKILEWKDAIEEKIEKK
ncbi:hypothetical protein ACK3SF_04040 [Candidatus Nanosalina sp. VS9-1]|uniref:hypothetical protein n=1 Tax=Candidatus Nanosalina sp. VS9-1 TaxID=3388566 RepID=UPI0039E187B8